MKKTLLIATALTTSAYTFSSGATQPSSSVLELLPAEVQKEIEGVRAACRGQLISEGDPDWIINTNDGLSLFTVSGRQAIMVNHRDVCGEGKGWKGITYTNRGSSSLAIYVRSRTIWKKAFSTDARAVFLSTMDYTVDIDGDVKFNDDGSAEFRALVVSVFLGSKECPIQIRKVAPDKVKDWKLSCDTVVRWNGTKFTYKPL